MGATLRALRALVLLLGFYLLSLVLLAALVGVDIAAFTWGHGPVVFKLGFVTVLLAIPVVRGMLMLRTPKGEDGPGIDVTEAAEPRLWALVREVAAAAGTRAPDRIRLTGEVNAAVSEEPRLLGLLPGPRRLYLGVPLLIGLTEAQLRSVLGHEYGHFTGGDTRLSALVVRGRVQIGRVIEQFHERADGKAAADRGKQERAAAKRVAKGKKAKAVDTSGSGAMYRVMAAIYTQYAKLYLRASLSTARGQEFAADQVAARIAGRDATAAMLREIPALSVSHGFYLDSYATLGLPARLLPPRGEFFGGFGRLLTAREQELERLRTELPEETEDAYDSHPPIAERVRRIEALPADGRAEEATGPALALLADPQRTLAALEDAVLTDEVLAFGRATGWPELLNASMASGLSAARTPLHQALADYTGQPPTLAALLETVDDGRLWQLADRLPLSPEASAARGRARREFARPVLRRSLRTMVLAEFSARSLLSWEFSWSRPAEVRLPGETTTAAGAGAAPEAALEAALDAVLADQPDTGALRALLPPAPQPV
ncbi:Zn-dependent protease with chaperone function [Streptomyces misionensis]|uniref:Zn-dependent protease with chaperone function n=1 Tax=Streptomyces misionensis TaxID=67331 RepID=A0A1H5B210_9ACTN|nr:M48 family metallopeptidase [Streptomyces misionensis]SED48465.1 Zn-dependent protease with chaperone function [Streptomyces misionensis]